MRSAKGSAAVAYDTEFEPSALKNSPVKVREKVDGEVVPSTPRPDLRHLKK